jgi:transcriptional regulator with XRE-family HTH domain
MIVHRFICNSIISDRKGDVSPVNAHEQRLKALGNYIKSNRAKRSPDSVGLPPGYNRRRTPGLRREEVAQLAGVSTTWYTWIEQGRDINVSREVLDSIGRALQLSTDEYIHMLNLAKDPIPAPAPARKKPISPALHKIVNDMAYPAMVVNKRSDVLAWNIAASSYFVDFSQVPEEERNMIWQWFTNKSLQSRIVNWEERSEYAIAVFRGFSDLYAGDPWFPQFVEELKRVSPFFKEQWKRHEVKQKSGTIIELMSPDFRKESFEITSFFNINGNEGIHFFVLTPIGETDAGEFTS